MLNQENHTMGMAVIILTLQNVCHVINIYPKKHLTKTSQTANEKAQVTKKIYSNWSNWSGSVV